MMKKRSFNKTKIWFVLAVYLFTTVLSMAGLNLEVQAAVDFQLTHDTATLREGETFDLELTMTNFSDTEAITDIVLDFSLAGIAALTTGSTHHFVSGITVGPKESEGLGIIKMRCVGDGSINIMPVTVTYKKGGKDSTPVTRNLYFNVQKGGTGPSDDDLEKIMPSLQVSIKGKNEVIAGESSTIQMIIKNISSNTAKNITFIPELKAPFIFAKPSQMPAEVKGNQSEEISISFDVDKFAKSGAQPFTFKLTYTNAWGYEKTENYTIFLDVKNYLTNATLRLQVAGNQNISATAGGIFNLPLVLENYGNLSAQEVKVTVSGLSQETFTLHSGTGRFDFYKIVGNEKKNIDLTLKSSSDLKTGSYPVNLKAEYLDEKGDAITEDLQIWIPVQGSEAVVSMLEIVEISPSKSTVKPGEAFSVAVKIKNSGNYEAKQIKVSADGSSTLLPVSQNMFIISSLKKDEVKEVVFKYQPQPEAPRGSVPITIKVENVGNKEGSDISQAITVFVDSTKEGGSDAGKNIPKIIVKSYSSQPTLVKAGERFDLNMQFLNTHTSKTIKNIKGNFIVTEASNETGSVFSPVDSSNTFYIDAIDPKGTCDWNLTLYTIPDAKSKTYTVTLSFEYEDEEGNPYKADELIGIPVYQPSRFEISEFYLPPETFMGNPIYLGFEMYNMGKTDIYNVKLSVDGDFEAQPKSNYFGNFESGRTEYFELNLMPMKTGKCDGRIVFQYENSSGEPQELIKEISMNVMEMMMPPEGEFPVDGPGPMRPGMEEPQKSFFKSVWFYVILGVVVVGVIVTVIVIVRKRKKKEEFDF